MERVSNSQQTAISAKKILIDTDKCFIDPTTQQRKNLVAGFALKNKIIYGKAFDIIKLKEGSMANINSVDSIQQNIKDILIYEIKSTSKKTINNRFDGYFFSLSTAELLVAQNLGKNFKFIFVNTLTCEFLELTLQEIFSKAKGIYPTCSIQF